MRSNDIKAIITDLAGIASATVHIPNVCGMVCGAVANIIANAGTFGSTQQLAAMDAASNAGFSPEYYVNTIRVAYVPVKAVSEGPWEYDKLDAQHFAALQAKMVDCGWGDDPDGKVRHKRMGLEQPSWVDAISACIEVASEA